MNKTPAYNKKEQNVLESFERVLKPKIEGMIAQIYKVLPLDYFGIDCSINEAGKMCIFELNANINVLINDKRSMVKHVKKINHSSMP